MACPTGSHAARATEKGLKHSEKEAVQIVLRIAIVGLGVAGSYLAYQLRDQHKVVAFDKMPASKYDAVCAWGTSKDGIAKFAKDCGLNFEDYIMHTGERMLVDIGKETFDIPLKGLVCFDKLKFIQDSADKPETHFGSWVNRSNFKNDFDMVVDATGLSRPLLPRINNDQMIPCVQYKVKYKDPPFDDFYIKPFADLDGYFWYFPLGNGYAHVGAGDSKKRYLEFLHRFLKEHDGQVISKTGRPVRITPPTMCEPFFDGNVVGVGESIGTVYSFLGEGIIPSLQCASLFKDNVENMSAYRAQVLQHFKIYETVYKFIKAKIEGNFDMKTQFFGLMSMFFHMKFNEKRYGLEIRLSDMLKVLRA